MKKAVGDIQTIRSPLHSNQSWDPHTKKKLKEKTRTDGCHSSRDLEKGVKAAELKLLTPTFQQCPVSSSTNTWYLTLKVGETERREDNFVSCRILSWMTTKLFTLHVTHPGSYCPPLQPRQHRDIIYSRRKEASRRLEESNKHRLAKRKLWQQLTVKQATQHPMITAECTGGGRCEVGEWIDSLHQNPAHEKIPQVTYL